MNVHEDEYNIIRASITVSDDDAPAIIGTYGQTLSSFETVFRSLLSRKDIEEKISVRFDVNDYRKKQEDRMLEIAREKAESVQATSMSQSMPPMSGFMRRIVHLYVMNNPDFTGVETESVGEGRDRRLHIRKKGSTESVELSMEGELE